MNYNKNSTNVQQYLSEKGLQIITNSDNKIGVYCIFNGCDTDSKGKECHLNFKKDTGQYNCFKCGAKGNIVTLKKHFGDITLPISSQVKVVKNFTSSCANECYNALPCEIREYIRQRGVSDEIISKYKLGYGNIWGKNWITIPMNALSKDDTDFLYLRKCPLIIHDGPKNLYFPKGGKKEARLYGEYAEEMEDLIICEGIFDCLSLLSLGHKALTSTGGCMTFKDEWIDSRLLKAKNIYVAYDNDNAGEEGALKALKLLYAAGHRSLYKITLPDLNDGGKLDVNDYVAKHKLAVKDLIDKHSEPYPKQIDVKQFKEMDLKELEDVLGLTIKGDRVSKLITFFCQLSAFTEENQFNVMYNAPSSTGKSYTAIETSKLFPKDSLVKLGNCSATAFFHDTGKYDKETNTITIDLSRKILIFTENQHYTLLERLRSFLSHDEKVMTSKITDKGSKGGNKTKTVNLVGYPAVIFCTASLKSDPQEKTRFIVLSPEMNDEKIRASIHNIISKESGNDEYRLKLENNERRKSLMLRIQAISNLDIKNINIKKEEEAEITDKILNIFGVLQPRHQRDVKRIIDLAKSIALLNSWFRELKDKTITVNQNDISIALDLYLPIAKVQSMNISPYIFDIYSEIILPAYAEKNINSLADVYTGISYQEITNYYYKIKKQKIDYNYLRLQIITELEACGLVEKQYTGNKVLIHVTDYGPQSQDIEMTKVSEDILRISSEAMGGVKNENNTC